MRARIQPYFFLNYIYRIVNQLASFKPRIQLSSQSFSRLMYGDLEVYASIDYRVIDYHFLGRYLR